MERPRFVKPFPFSTQTPVEALLILGPFSVLFFLPFFFTFNIAMCLDAKQQELFGLYQREKQTDTLHRGAVH